MIRALAVLAAVAVCASPVLATDEPTPAPAPRVAEVVPRAKFIKAVRARDREAARADRLERVLRHDDSVQEAINLAAFAYGVDPGRMTRIAFCESRFSPVAVNGTSGASGLFQFLPSTWNSNRYGAAGFSVWSPLASALGAAYHMSRYGDRAWECRP